jgi:serine/threonine protein kinase/tetratricopeptide (TPR) repeat protein
MAPEDGDRADDAFAPTIAPSSSNPTPPQKLPAGTMLSRAELAVDATVAAPLAGDNTLPPLPEVAKELYTTDKEIARGGMGRIVAAEDRRLGRPVALKELLDPHGEQITRFQREALITARLQHPGIVPVYEAGRWPSGEPFFAMKLVSGRPFDRVIADATKLDDRLALLPRLASACDAIAYAHSQRIVHRDLKPGNVLLGDFGETVVIDWGLAKDLDAIESPESQNRSPRAQIEKPEPRDRSQSSTLTIAGAVMGTPAYMPPEQARGETVDQRADVFALGAMLYHLLAGVPPYNSRTATDVLAAAALGRVIPLVERERRSPKELITIVERAMAPVPSDRYPNAGELADELRRFLTGQLVGAHSYTALERVGRFVRKHRAAVAIATLATVGFAVGGTIAVHRIVEARDEARAEAEIAKVRKRAAERLIDYTLTHVQGQLRTIGRLDLLAGLGSEVRRYYDTIAKVPGGMPSEDEIRMVEAIDMIGEAEHTSGKPDQALATWKFAREKIARFVGTDTSPRTFRMRRLRAKIDTEAGAIMQERGQFNDAVAQFSEAKREWDDLEKEQPKERQLMLEAAEAHDKLGDVLRTEGKIDPAFDEYSEAKVERERATTTGNGQVTEEKTALATSHLKLGSVYQLRGESALALEEYKQALRLREQLLASEPDSATFQEKVLDVMDSLADVQHSTGDDDAAIATYRAALPMTAELVQRDATNAEWQRWRGRVLADLGYALLTSGRFQASLDSLGQAIALQKDLTARDPKSTRYKVDLSRSYTRGGDAYIGLGRVPDGVAEYKLALDIRRDLVDKEATSVPFRRSYAWSYAKLASAYAQSGDVPKALEAHEQALALRQALVTESPSQSGFKDELASTEVELGRLLAAADPKRATELVTHGVTRSRALVDNDPINNDWKLTLLQGLLAHAAVAKASGDAPSRASALADAHKFATDARAHAPQNVQIAGLYAEIEIGVAELAAAKGDTKAANTAWDNAKEVLEPLAKDGRLPAARSSLLDRARARR